MINLRFLFVVIAFLSVAFTQSTMSLDALYPWNLGTSAYYTYGKYSDGKQYRSYAGYVSMDRRWRDRFAISYEDLKVTTDSTVYRQYNVLGRDFFWIKTGFRIGGIVGFFDSNIGLDTMFVNSLSQEKQTETHLNGWIAGTQITGDLRRFGYAVSYIHSEYFNVEHVTDIRNYPERFSLNDTTYYYDEISEIFVNQYTGIIGKKFGDHIFRLGGMVQQVNDDYMYSAIGTWLWQPTDPLSISASLNIGESRFSVDPYALVINNNPDVLRDLSNINITYRINTNWHLIGVYSFHRYETLEDDKPYHSNFFTIGFQGRF